MSTDTHARAREYIEAGWSLCAVEPGTKKAAGDGWQHRGRPASHWTQRPEDGMGLVHGLSGTCALDLDDLEAAHVALAAVGVDLAALLAAPDAVRVASRPGRGKLLYRTDADLARRALNWPKPDPEPDGAQKYAVLELRAGPVMDVLPPSIHPDTGEAYRWEGDWRALPALPAELLAVWENWTEAKRDMERACPWDDTPAVSADRYAHVERRRYGEGESVIAAFNAAHPLRAVLESFGYRRAGVRLISPHSESGMPGTVILPGSDGRLCYVHHASDPLCDGHAHDAFSVWCVHKHAGDVTRAVREAAEMLGMSHAERDQQEGAEIAARILSRTPPPPERPSPIKPDAPPEPPSLTIPVAPLADLEHWLRLRHFGAKRIATTQGALAFAAAMTTRRYVTTERQPTNVMLGVVDSSTAGLRPLRGALYDAAAASGERAIIRGTKLSSDSTLYRALMRSPRMFWASDEYGQMVAFAKRQPSGAIESALAAVHDTYNAYPLYLDPDTIGAKKDVPLSECTVEAPGLVMLALLSEDQMREITRRSEYGRGSVQQLLVARAGALPDEDAGRHPGAPVPQSVLDTVKALRLAEQQSLGGLASIATHTPIVATVEHGAGVADAHEETRAALRLVFADTELARWRGIAHGALVTAKRLAAALGAWADPERPVVTADVARWCGAWVVYHVTRSVEWYDAIASDDGEPDLISDVRGLLYAAGTQGLTGRELARRCRAFRRLSVSQRDELLEQMASDRLIALVADKRTTYYVDRAYLTPVESAHA